MIVNILVPQSRNPIVILKQVQDDILVKLVLFGDWGSRGSGYDQSQDYSALS